MELVALLVLAVFIYVLWGRVKVLQARVEELDGAVAGLRSLRAATGAGVAMAPVGSKAPETMRPSEAAPIATAAAPTVAAVAPPAAKPDTVREAPVMPLGARKSEDAEPAALPPAPARKQGIEELIGTRWAVWVGGIALALGAILLVRYSIEAGLFGPAFRIALGAALAVALAIAGEWLRRSGGNTPAFAGADVPAILTAAATVAAFATTYSAHALFGFIDAGPAFGLMGLVGLATLGAALMHGPALAGLGLAASLATPALVTPGAIPNPWPVVVYLLVVGVAAYVLGRAKRWQWLMAAAGAGAIVWGLVLVDKADSNALWWPAAMLHTLAQLAVAAVALAVMVPQQDSEADSESAVERDFTATALFAGFAMLSVGVLLANNGLSWASMTFAGATIAVLALVGRSRPGLAWVAVAAGLVLVAFALLWPGVTLARPAQSTLLEWLLPTPLLAPTYGVFMGLAAVLVGLVSAERMLRRPLLVAWAACVHAGVAVIVPLAVLVIGTERLTHALTSPWAAGVAAALAGLFALGTLRFQTEERAAGGAEVIRLGTGALAAGTVAAVVLALLYGLERGYLTVALAGAALGTALAADWKRIPVLRSAVGVIGVLVLARLVWDPLVMGVDVGTRPVLNWLLLGYGAPAVALFGAARLLEREKTDSNSGVADALALLFAGLLVFMQIRHGLHGPAGMLTALPDHTEQGLMALMAFGGSYVLMQLRGLRANPVFRAGSIILAVIATASAVLALGLVNNPVLASGELVKGNVALNSLMLGYLLPGAMAGWLAWKARAAERPEWLITTIGLAAAGLLVGFLLLELRFWFNGADVRYVKGAGHVEAGLGLALVLAAALVLTGIALMRKTDAVSMVTLVVSGVAVLMLLAGLGVNANPLLTGETVMGPAFAGSLGAAYLLPAMAAAALAWHARAVWPRAYVLAMGAIAVIAAFGWVTLSVRQMFQGPMIGWLRPTSEMEIWAHSAAWLVMGLMLLAYGMVRGVIEARAASAVFVVATVLKVFLLDLAGLTGFWRAISFIGLGLVLIGIGLVYQRVLVKGQSEQARGA